MSLEMNHTVQYEGTPHSTIRTEYLRLAAGREYEYQYSISWHTDKSHEETHDLIEQHVGRMSVNQYGYVALAEADNLVAYIDIQNSGFIEMLVRSTSISIAREYVELFKEILPVSKPVEDKVSIDFWANTGNGPVYNRRKIAVPTWAEIQDNYTGEVRDELDWLMARADGEDLRDGKLVLWRGQPGTGKTYALRALAREWRLWADFFYITDPEKFFGDAAYMNHVMLNSSGDRWKVLILEDSGELLAPTAKQDTGQGLSRLLNIVDGMLGQGLQFIVLVTTNEEMKSLHPAVQRNGRCSQRLEFLGFNAREATEWLAERDCEVELDAGHFTVSELYAKLKGEELPGEKKRMLGFAA
jgi:SpoVK/Ycf46/Vps4 family AAA+-type ATPase